MAKILHSIITTDPERGGVVEAVKQLSAATAVLGHETEVVCLDAPDSPWLKGGALPVHALGVGVGTYRYNSRLAPWLRANRHRYDAVVIDGLWGYSSFGSWLALHKTNTPYFVFPHGMLDPWFKRTYPLKHLKKWLYWPWGDYRVLRDATSVLFTCEQERLLARQSFWLYRCREQVVTLGTIGPVGDVELQKRSFLSQYPALAGKRCLLFLGRVHAKKGVDLLLRAFAQFLANERDTSQSAAHLVMAGPYNDNYGVQMMALADSLGLGNRVTWTGMLKGDLKWGALYTADAFILPSHQENFGVAVAEALACSLPVLISDQVNIWREIAADQAGLVEPDTLVGTVNLLTRWAKHSDKEGMRQNARICFKQRFDLTRAGHAFVEAIDPHLKKREAGTFTV
jgi:glycosyltransferase involved in cell wall biosynthesis